MGGVLNHGEALVELLLSLDLRKTAAARGFFRR